jgi:hypothetical protein
MVLIGIGVNIESSIFINGHGITAYAVYEALRRQYPNAEYVFVNCSANGRKEWFVDMEKDVPRVISIYNATDIDIFIDFTDAIHGKRPGKMENILFVRKPYLFSLGECCIYAQIQTSFHPRGYSSIWTWSSNKDDIEALKLIFKIPVHVISPLWSSNILDKYMVEKTASLPNIPANLT